MNVNYIELIKIINKGDPVTKKNKNFTKIWSVRVNVSKSTGLRHYIAGHRTDYKIIFYDTTSSSFKQRKMNGN